MKLNLELKMEVNEMRLAKYLAHSGAASRRKSEDLIRQGRVKINGSVVVLPQTAVSKSDLVTLDEVAVSPSETKDYYLLNKPAGYLSTVQDTHDRPTVLDLIDEHQQDRRLYPVGRLDADTNGMLLLTNDGELAYRLTHPKYRVKKVYQALVYGIPGKEKLEYLKRGIIIEEMKTAPTSLTLLKVDRELNMALVEIILTEGRKRQVKLMLAAIGHPVKQLTRVSFAGLEMGQLAEKNYRRLSAEEISYLKKLVQLEP
jgi:23S rRNA pseudouridine2605 synthase